MYIIHLYSYTLHIHIRLRHQLYNIAKRDLKLQILSYLVKKEDGGGGEDDEKKFKTKTKKKLFFVYIVQCTYHKLNTNTHFCIVSMCAYISEFEFVSLFIL